MAGKVYELNGEEQTMLEVKCIELHAITNSKAMRQDAILTYTNEIEVLKGQQRDIIASMADTFNLTRTQVINKVIAEGRK